MEFREGSFSSKWHRGLESQDVERTHIGTAVHKEGRRETFSW